MSNCCKKLKTINLIIVVLAGSLWFACLCHAHIIFNMLSLRYVHPFSTKFMLFSSLAHPGQRLNYSWVKYKDISIYLKRAAVVAEDDRFYEHKGLDLKGIRYAAKVNWKKKKLARGGSTITQQLVKNLYLSPSKNILRKGREMLLATIIDALLSKQRILELYLNVIEWGPNVFGASAASEYYFKSKPKNLNAAQAAFLASILPNPKKLGKRGYRLSRQTMVILNRM